MKKKKMIIEITLIVIAGLITLYVSVSSIVKAEKQEEELKENQKRLNEKSDTIIALQTKMQEKSEKVIKLQNRLIQNSISQIDNINKLRNPAPAEVRISFQSELIIPKEELVQISQALRSRGNNSNLLPADFTDENEGIKRIKILKDILFTLNIKFISEIKK